MNRPAETAGADASMRELVDALLEDAAVSRRDDIAVVVAHRHATVRPPAPEVVPDVSGRWVYPLAPPAASAMRRDLRAALGNRVGGDLVEVAHC